ncbi:MAG: hypothetical protein HY906_04110 [Deltaproteobacteria bacterium]|nr:hypothetical protein [Deltaproteobacteria bacterium]
MTAKRAAGGKPSAKHKPAAPDAKKAAARAKGPARAKAASRPKAKRHSPLDLWREFARHAAKEDPTYDPVAPGVWPPSWPPATYHLSTPAPKRLLYFTKDFLLKQWLQQGPLPAGLGAVVRYGMATPNYCAWVKREAKALRLPVLFVGDCDPYDLTVFLSLQRGSDELVKTPATTVPVQYLGIDDRWLAMCAAAFSPPEGGNPDFKLVMVEMTPLERRHLEVLLKVAPELERLVGPRCRQILLAGRKLELEGACSRSLYAEGFCQKLLHHVEHAAPRG